MTDILWKIIFIVLICAGGYRLWKDPKAALKSLLWPTVIFAIVMAIRFYNAWKLLGN